MTAPTLTDADVPGWWTRLGLPGLFDVHVHFLPPPVMRKVRAQFDSAGPLIGRAWPLHYRGDDEQRVAQLRALGVRRFSALPYAHRPGIAEYLNDWAAGLAAAVPEVLRSATFFPEREAVSYVARRIAGGTDVFKVHVQVGDFDPRDAALREVWGMLADAAVPVVVHCGSGPIPGRHTGPGPFGEVLAAHPALTAVIAHGGAPEYREHLELVRRYPNVHLDTTMVGTDFMNRLAPVPADVVAAYADVADRIVLGTDFPNIPYPYAEQLTALERFGLGDDWLRAVCWDNGARLLGLPAGPDRLSWMDNSTGG
jgi:predicted TIM-barrel fold metal-dependent hydrolase